MVREGEIHIGTSGWYYDHWKGPFYPGDIAKKNFLDFYQNVFATVEINNVFYHLPTIENLFDWYEAVPDDFVYAVKASRYITHVKRLKSVEDSCSAFMDRMEILGDKLGPILFQLPPKWNCNIERLSHFLGILPRGMRYVFEFRDPSWFNNEVYQILRSYNAACCIYHLADFLSPKEITGDFVYVRLHGPEGSYKGKYSDAVLTKWAKQFQQWSRSGITVYCYFDNDEAGFAAMNALTLINLIKKNDTR